MGTPKSFNKLGLFSKSKYLEFGKSLIQFSERSILFFFITEKFSPLIHTKSTAPLLSFLTFFSDKILATTLAVSVTFTCLTVMLYLFLTSSEAHLIYELIFLAPPHA